MTNKELIETRNRGAAFVTCAAVLTALLLVVGCGGQKTPKQKPKSGGTGFGDPKYLGDGTNPDVAANGVGDVVEVHEAGWSNTLWYTVGSCNGTSVAWGSAMQMADGTTPTVALNSSGWVVNLHKSTGDLQMWYQVGKLNRENKTIDWGTSVNCGRGSNASVGITDDGWVITVSGFPTHKEEDLLCYRTGKLNTENRTIAFGELLEFSEGRKHPSVGVSEDGRLITAMYIVDLTHSKNDYHNTIERQIGRLDPSSGLITWKAGTNTGRAASYTDVDVKKCPGSGLYSQGIITLGKEDESSQISRALDRVGADVTTPPRGPWEAISTGNHPAIAIGGNPQFVIEVHKSANSKSRWYSCAAFNLPL